MSAPALAERTVEVDGRPVRLLEHGRGAVALVLLHGAPAAQAPFAGAAELWDPLLAELPADVHAIALDLPGCGGSPAAGVEELTVAGTTARVAATLRALDLSAAIPVGHAEAALVALALARRPPEDVAIRGVAVVASASAAPMGDGVPNLTLLHPPAPRWSRTSQRWALERISHHHAHVTDALLDALVSHADGPAHRAAAELLAAEGVATRLRTDRGGARLELFAYCRDVGYELPICVVWGASDPLASVAHGDALLELLSTNRAHTELAVVNRAGHLPFRDEPAAVARALLAFTELTSTAGGPSDES